MRISTAGLVEHQDDRLGIRSYVLTNQITVALLLISLAVFAIFTFLFPDNTVIRTWTTLLSGCLAVGIGLNARGYFTFSQFLISTGLTVMLLSMTIHSKLHHPWLIHEGSYYNPRYFMIGLAFIPLVVFDIRQRLPLIFSVSINLLLLALYNPIHRAVGAAPEQIGLPVVDLNFVSVASTSAGFAIALGMVFLKRANFRYERRIEELLETTRKQNEELNSSIRYARRLQEAILSPVSPEETDGQLEVMLSPRDQLSGDFFFYYPNGGHPYLSVVDCTGHGVPGAFVSLMANKALHQSVRKHGDVGPAAVMLDVQRRFTREFMQHGGGYVHDGMDLMICRIHPESRLLAYSGARGIGFLITATGLVTLDTDRRSIGDGSFDSFTSFTQPYSAGDLLVLTSDGLQDQFGGESNKKIGKRRLRSFLEELHGCNATEARRRIRLFVENWQGTTEQTDDICVAVYKLQ
ncbi:MAG: PP2C family protein-serine/threonine phosphatase [Flavobacteriales bacterium]